MQDDENDVRVRARRLDHTDLRILTLLQGDARLTNKEIAEQVNLSQTPCLRRIGILEEQGFISGYSAQLDPARMGFSIRAFISLKRQRESSREALEQLLVAIPEVLSCHVVSGEFDLLVEVVARDMEDYSRVALDQIGNLPGIYDLRTTFAIRTVKSGGALPLEPA